MPAFIDLTGRRFGRLAVLRRAENDSWNQTTWLCRCDCGVEKVVKGNAMARGHTQSCGCFKIDKISALNRTHGQGGVYGKTSEYRIWANMVNRCTNPNNPAFKHYGGRGITVCDEWRQFENFFADMGRRPKGLTLDRQDNNKGYSKENCHWTTPKRQARNVRTNRLVEFMGRKMPMSEASELAGARYRTVWWRLNEGWSLHEALYGRA